jgi:hypothetical protein
VSGTQTSKYDTLLSPESSPVNRTRTEVERDSKTIGVQVGKEKSPEIFRGYGIRGIYSLIEIICTGE